MMKLTLALAALLFPAVALAQPCVGPCTPPLNSPVTVVSTSGSLTCCGGATTETNIAALKIPANSMGKNGSITLSCLIAYPNSANNKTITLRYTSTAGSTSGGQTGGNTVFSTTVNGTTLWTIRNNNSTSAQIGSFLSGILPYTASGSSNLTLTVDTTLDSFVNINATTASGAETITLQHCSALIMKAP